MSASASARRVLCRQRDGSGHKLNALLRQLAEPLTKYALGPLSLRAAAHRTCDTCTAANARCEERQLRRQGDSRPENHGKHGGKSKKHNSSEYGTATTHTLQLPSENRASASRSLDCGVHAFEPPSSRKAHRGGTVRQWLSITGHDDVNRMGGADTSRCLPSRGSYRLLRYLPFCLLFLFAYHLFPTLVLILLAFVSHCAPPFPVIPHLLAARVPLRRQFCPC